MNNEERITQIEGEIRYKLIEIALLREELEKLKRGLSTVEPPINWI